MTGEKAVQNITNCNNLAGLLSVKTIPFYLTSLNSFGKLFIIKYLQKHINPEYPKILLILILTTSSFKIKQIISRYGRQSKAEEYYRIHPCILSKKLPCHPQAVGQYPEAYGYVVHQFRSVAYGFYGQVYSHSNCGDYHQHTSCFKFQCPEGVLYQP